ncbi:hypothetical protein IMZ48_15165 [Candidatus Bathyarchaeota archaeon]|nr:hypothetical protein [Candidatus Bathyarchaeota archaeon]
MDARFGRVEYPHASALQLQLPSEIAVATRDTLGRRPSPPTTFHPHYHHHAGDSETQSRTLLVYPNMLAARPAEAP